MKEYSGFIELELPQGDEFHKYADLKLNSARHSILHVCLSANAEKVYLPVYLCESVKVILTRYEFEVVEYNLYENLKPEVTPNELGEKDFLIYPNYFGLNETLVSQVCETYKNVIVDNTQAFYAKPAKDQHFCYSPRKFFGVADGGYLYTPFAEGPYYKQAISYKNYEHLLGRIDTSANDVYKISLVAEEAISKQDILQMSKLTHRILCSIDYQKIAKTRQKNFQTLSMELNTLNQFSFALNDQVPMVYPLWIKNNSNKIRKKLINNKVYIPQWWKYTLKNMTSNSFEKDLSMNLLPLPIDQRYDENDMKFIIRTILEN